MNVAESELKMIKGEVSTRAEGNSPLELHEKEGTARKIQLPSPRDKDATNRKVLERSTPPKNDEEDDILVYEAALEYTQLERSDATACKLTCIRIVIVIIASIVFIFSFPFSLFLILFVFDTKKSCLPFKSIRDSPWRLYLTRSMLHYHLPNPPHRPYINVFYCLMRVYKFTIPLEDISSIAVENFSINHEYPSSNTDRIDSPKLENIILHLKRESPGIDAPVSDYLGLCSRCQTVHTLVIYSVKDASIFTEAVKEHMMNSAAN